VSGHPGAGASRDMRLAHARDCAACRARLLAEDPTAIFAFLKDVEIPEALLRSVSAGVAAELDRAPRVPWLRPAAAWAAAAALALGLLVPAALHRGGLAPTIPSAPAAVSAASPRAGIEAIRTPGPAQVLDLTVGDTQVVMIFDAELSL
jgi:hypothetical protein